MLIFVVSGCMFYLGVMVGRNNSPVHFDMDSMNKKLSTLQKSVLAENTASTKKIEKKLNENMPFDFYDNLKGNLDPTQQAPQQNSDSRIKRPLYPKPPWSTLALAKVVDNAPEMPPEKKPATEPAVKPESVSTPAPPEAASPNMATQGETQARQLAEAKQIEPVEHAAPAPVEQPAVEKPPAASQPVPGGRQYAIQVASLKDTQSAEIIRDKFRAKGYPAYTQEAMVEGRGQWYRVRLGPYKDRTQAESDLSRLQKAGVDAILFLSDATANSSFSGGKQ